MLILGKDLFWLIRQGDNIAIFSDNADLIHSMQVSSHTNFAYINNWSDNPVDLILIDEGFNQPIECIKAHLKPDSRIILHKNNKLNTLLKNDETLLFEQERQEYYVYHNNPLVITAQKFAHPRFEKYFKELNTNLCSFSRDYHNPHIYRALIQMGSRIENPDLLFSLCQKVIDTYPETSADVGGCLCVMGYQVFVSKTPDEPLFNRIVSYCNVNMDSQNPHVVRWITSLLYFCGLYSEELLKKPDIALNYYISATKPDFTKFSSLICTKQVSACYKAALVYLEYLNNKKKALEWFTKGIELAKRALCLDHDKTIGKDGIYIPFSFSELSEISNIAGLCVNGFNNIELYDKNRAVYKKLVTSNHFGLITRCQQLEKQVEELKDQLSQHI